MSAAVADAIVSVVLVSPGISAPSLRHCRPTVPPLVVAVNTTAAPSHAVLGPAIVTPAVSPMFTETHVLFAMDAEFQTNHAFRMDRISGEREELGELDGPVYYTISRGEDFFFAVTAELCPSQVGRNASLWHLPPSGKLRKLHSIEKDRWPVQLLPGTMHFPGGPGNPDHFHFHCVGLAGADGRVFEVRKV